MVKESEQKEYRKNFGTTILFSGVQVFQILIRIVRSKFVAMLIGPTGLGISSLLRSTTDLISSATSLGLKTSGVKSVSSANAENDKLSIARTIIALRRLILITGILGAVICSVLSPVWSKLSFGNSDYIVAFVIVSLTILFDQLTGGEIVLLQGLQMKRFLARVNVIGQTLGLVLTIPLYYFYGVKAIPWVFALSSILTYIITIFYTRRVKLLRVKVSFKETFSIGREMIKLGFFLSLQMILGYLSTFFIRNVVSHIGGVNEVGLYSAGIAIVNVYLGLVFAAISTDYFPRLAATKNIATLSSTISRQANITMLLFIPIVTAFIIFIKPVIIILYSDRFLPVENMLYWAIGATIVKSLGWSMSYSLLAKAKPLFFFYNELAVTIYGSALQIAGYYLWGLTGFGIAILAGYCIYLVQMTIVTKRYFNYHITNETRKLFALGNLAVMGAVIIRIISLKFDSDVLMYVIGALYIVIISYFVIVEFNKKMDLVGYVKEKWNSYKNK